MAYSPTEWRDYEAGNTLITAARLNKLEAGVQDAANDADANTEAIATLTGDLDAMQKQMDATSSTSTALDRIATALDLETGDVTLGIASDSTANDTNDWVYLWLKLEAAKRGPDLRVVMDRWNNATEAYDQFIIQAGNGTPATGGTILTDGFNREAADLVGTTTAEGKVWEGIAGVWSADGTKARTSGVGALSYNTAQRDGRIAAALSIITTKPAATQQLRVSTLGTSKAFAGSVWAGVTLSTAGTVVVTLWKTVSGTSTQLGAITTDLAADTATAQALEVTLDVSIQNITLITKTATKTASVAAQITEADYTTLGTYRGLGLGSTTGSQFAVDNVTMAVPITPATYRTLHVLNWAVAGMSLEYQRARIATLMGSRNVDAIFIAHGHNYGNTTAAAYVALVKQYAGEVAAQHPETVFGIVSQNPQFPPAANPAAHLARQAAIRLYALGNGWSYIPALEAFKAQPDDGDAMVGPDGVHPTTTPTSTPVDGYGSSLWAHVMLDAISKAGAL